jgi:predicted Zn-dependent protease
MHEGSLSTSGGRGRARVVSGMAWARWPAGHRLTSLLVLLALLTTFVLTFWDQIAVSRVRSQAVEALAAWDNARALSELRMALREDLNDKETLFLLARGHRRVGDYRRMSLILDRLAELEGDPDRILRERRLAMAQSGQIDETEPYLPEMLVNAGVDGPDICQAFVQGYFSKLLIEPAISLLDTWQSSFPDDAQPLFMRGYVWRGMGHNEKAVEFFRKALAIAPERTLIRRQLAEALLETNQADQAEAQLAICLEQTPKDATVYRLLAQCSYLKGELESSRNRLQTALKLDPGDFEARRLNGQLALTQAAPAEAAAELQEVVRQRPHDLRAREALGRALQQLGQTAEAEEHFAFVSRGEESMARLNRLIREALEQPDNVAIRLQVGSILFEYGSAEDAVRWLQSVLDLEPEQPDAHRMLAEYYSKRGNPFTAATHSAFAAPEESPQ